MFKIVEELLAHHGIKSVMVSIKPHGTSMSATINLIPDTTVVADQAMRAALATPIVLIGTAALENMSVESVLEQVKRTLNGHAYFNPTAINDRIIGANSTDVAKATNQQASKVPVVQPATQPCVDDFFAQDSL